MLFQATYRMERVFDRDEILWHRDAGHGSTGKPFQILNRSQSQLQLLTQRKIVCQLLEPALPFANRFLIEQRIEKPLPEPAGTHRRQRSIQNRQQRSLPIALIVGLELEIPSRRLI